MGRFRHGMPTMVTGVLLIHMLWSPVLRGHTHIYSGGEAWGETVTGDSRNRIVFIGDTQVTRPWEFWRENNRRETAKLLREIARRRPSVLIPLGDLVSSGVEAKHWKTFDELFEPLCASCTRCYPVLGNHDYYGAHRGGLANFFNRFPHLGYRRWYSFSHGRLGFLMIDSNFSRMSPEERTAQVRWFHQELGRFQSSAATHYIVVCCHHPPYTNSLSCPPSRTLQKHYVKPFLRASKTVLFFSGHIHAYERFHRQGKFFIVSGGGGGSRGRVETREDKRRYTDCFAGSSLRFLHFCEMNVRSDVLDIRVVKLTDSGKFEVADRFHIPGPSSPLGSEYAAGAGETN